MSYDLSLTLPGACGYHDLQVVGTTYLLGSLSDMLSWHNPNNDPVALHSTALPPRSLVSTWMFVSTVYTLS